MSFLFLVTFHQLVDAGRKFVRKLKQRIESYNVVIK